MRKFIILLDRDGDLLSYIMKHTSFDLAILVCEHNDKTKALQSAYAQRIKHTLDYANLLEVQHSTHIDYALVRQMKSTQIDIETMLHRVMFNNPIAKDIYYQYLSFFTEIFEKYNIDFVLNAEMILSTPHHLIPCALAKLNNIPAYSLDGINDNICLFYYNTRSPLKFQEHNKPQSHIQDQRFYTYDTHLQENQANLKSKIMAWLYKIGGSILIEFVACLKKFNFTSKFMGVEYNYFSKLYSFIQHKNMHRFYKKHTLKPSLDEKFIYFNLHLEPEAAVIGRAELEAQLTLIKMTARALPKGWKLYVKEHPHQLMFNDALTNYFLHNVAFFKNIEFYKHIMRVPNTLLISLDISSKELIKKAQAIATFDGTVTLESVGFSKPVILFNATPSPYQFLGNTLHVYSYQDLQNAIQKIQDGFPYEQLDEEQEFNKLSPYISNAKDPHFFENLLETITQHAASLKEHIK